MKTPTPTQNVPHCESCGAEHPNNDGDGYTQCCNELICYGDVKTWIVEHTVAGKTATQKVQACCSAKLEDAIDRWNLKVTHSYRSSQR